MARIDIRSDQCVSKPKHQSYRALIIPRKQPKTQHVQVQIPLLSIVCYLSCHSNILLQTVLTNKLQKSQQIDRYSVCPVVRGTSSTDDVLQCIAWSKLKRTEFQVSYYPTTNDPSCYTPTATLKHICSYIVVAKEALRVVNVRPLRGG